jgi:hypothetical protein
LRQDLIFLAQLTLNFAGIGVVWGLIGVRQLWRNQRNTAVLFTAIFALQAVFFTGYSVFDKWTMFHTAYLIWAIFVGIGLNHMRTKHFQWTNLLYVVMALAITIQLIGNGFLVTRSDDRFIHQRSITLLSYIPENALIIGQWTTIRPIEYLQIVEQQRSDIATLDITILALSMEDQLGTHETSVIREATRLKIAEIVRCNPNPVFVIGTPISIASDVSLVQVADEVFRVDVLSAEPCGE